MLLSGLLNWTHDCWPGRGAAYAVPGVLVLLAVYAVWRGSAVRAASVLRYGVYLIFLLLAISGLLQLRWSQLRPRAELPSMALAAALLLPLLGRKGKTWHVFPNGLIAAAAAFITAGTASLYAYSRGLSLAGVTEHLESLAACALTAGWFASICYVLDSVKEKEEKDNRIPFLGVLAYGIYALGVRFRPEIFVILELTLWAVIPTLWSMREKLRNGVK